MSSNSLNNINSEKIKILVVGDSGVGKTSLVHLVCHGDVLKNAIQTIGCNIEVKLHECNNVKYFLEFYDICGSEKYIKSRSMFYGQTHGIILVHDLTNKKSYSNLQKWIKEIKDADIKFNSSSPVNGSHYKNPNLNGSWGPSSISPTIISSYEKKQYNSNNNNELEPIFDLELTLWKVPVIVIGNKLDLSQKVETSILDQIRPDIFHVSSISGKSFAVNSHDLKRIESFFNTVIALNNNYNDTKPRNHFKTRNLSDGDDTYSRAPRSPSSVHSISFDHNNNNSTHSHSHSVDIFTNSPVATAASLDSMY